METLVRAVARSARPLSRGPEAFDRLLEQIGDARLVLLGEASHGTHEFYRQRALLSRRLVEEKGFAAIAVEGDWPDCQRVNRFVRGFSGAATAVEALGGGFKRFPTWMWRNADVLDLAGWLREHNDRRAASEQAGFYGLDLYSLHASIDEVVRYLEKRDPAAAAEARNAFACFDAFGPDPESYGWAATMLRTACEEPVIRQLVSLRSRRLELTGGDGVAREEEYFDAEQNAHVVAGAERYYRSMMQGSAASWNTRDRHMADTLVALLRHLDRRFGRAKIVVWAHNSHIGDASATGMSARGEHNLGQLARELFGMEDARLIGFTTSTGTVTAASDWGGPAERKHVRPPLEESWEKVFHRTGIGSFYLPLGEAAPRELRGVERLERFIGVLYLPRSERWSHYNEARIAEQFDALIHTDLTRAVEPLERLAPKTLEVPEDAPETYPFGV